jgi:hypothetical protein
MKSRVCQKCKRDLPIENYGKNASKRDGLQEWCQDCKIEYNHQWYESNKERHRDYVNSHKDRSKHVCKNCGRGEPEVSFYIKKEKGKLYPRFLCRECDAEYHKKYPSSKESKDRHRNRRKEISKVERKDESLRCKIILKDSKVSDRKKERQNDLDREFIRNLIDEGCSYCLDKDGRMTLDRVDNSLGHLKSNVVACCMRCNFIRRDMPHIVWMTIVPKIRQARLLGMLEGWNPGTVKSQRKTAVVDLDVLNGL